MNKLNGLLYGIISSASFGLIPLFAIPAMQHGMVDRAVTKSHL